MFRARKIFALVSAINVVFKDSMDSFAFIESLAEGFALKET